MVHTCPAGNAQMKADDETDSTHSETEESTGSGNCGRNCYQSDLPWSHLVTIMFVEFFLFQFRLECRIRKGLGYVISPSKWNLKRKRKNSSVLSYDDCDLDLPKPHSVQRSTSDSDVSVDDNLELMMSHSREERLNMRRGTAQCWMEASP